jgi:hypothetical protein
VYNETCTVNYADVERTVTRIVKRLRESGATNIEWDIRTASREPYRTLEVEFNYDLGTDARMDFTDWGGVDPWEDILQSGSWLVE